MAPRTSNKRNQPPGDLAGRELRPRHRPNQQAHVPKQQSNGQSRGQKTELDCGRSHQLATPRDGPSFSVSPFQRLPDELVLEIFMHCERTIHVSRRGVQEELSTLTQICSNWRRVAMGSPSLWCELSLLIDHGGYVSSSRKSPTTKTIQTRIDQLLTLSKHRFLDISISVYRQWENCALLSHICSYSDRWRSLVLFLSVRSPQRGLLAVLERKVPNLEYALVNLWYPDNVPKLFTGTRRLKTLELNHAHSCFLPVMGQIVNLELSLDHDVLSLLTEAPNIQTLTLHSRIRKTDLLTPTNILTFSHCTSLKVSAFHDKKGNKDRKDTAVDSPLIHLSMLWCPSLTRLAFLSSGAGSNASSIQIVQSFLHQSGCTLTFLAFTFQECNPQHLFSFCASLPTLTQVQICDSASDYTLRRWGRGLEHTAPSLMASRLVSLFFSDAGFLPLLERLELSLCCQQVEDGAVTNMLIRRSQAGLKYFTLHIKDRAFAPQSFDPLTSLRDGMLKVSITARGCTCERFCNCLQVWRN